MAHARRDQKHLGIDTNVLVAYLDADHPQHHKAARLASRRIALNPTVMHETCHTLVFKLKWTPEDAANTLIEMLDDKEVLFLNQTKEMTRTGLQLARKHSLGGRDALILASFFSPSVLEIVTLDSELMRRRKIERGSKTLKILMA
jgi:predicted nucleic acid-binding protein